MVVVVVVVVAGLLTFGQHDPDPGESPAGRPVYGALAAQHNGAK